MAEIKLHTPEKGKTYKFYMNGKIISYTFINASEDGKKYYFKFYGTVTYLTPKRFNYLLRFFNVDNIKED